MRAECLGLCTSTQDWIWAASFRECRSSNLLQHICSVAAVALHVSAYVQEGRYQASSLLGSEIYVQHVILILKVLPKHLLHLRGRPCQYFHDKGTASKLSTYSLSSNW